MSLSLTESDISKIYNLNCIKKKIQKFYKEIINIEFEEDFFDAKKSIEQQSEEQFRRLSELITIFCWGRRYGFVLSTPL